MRDTKGLALIGAALIFVGVFMPIVNLPIVGSINYFNNGRGDGTIILLLAVVAAALAVTGRVRHVIWSGIGSLLILGFTFFRFQSHMAEMKAKMETELAGNPFRGLADAAVQSVQLQWGWAVLIIGSLLLVYAGWASRSGTASEGQDLS